MCKLFSTMLDSCSPDSLTNSKCDVPRTFHLPYTWQFRLMRKCSWHRPLSKLMLNHECNATSAMQITHLFVTRMLAKNMKGCVVFTSSAAACQPTPFSALYGATKSYISSFAANIAVELKSRGIDVCAVHPSPVASNFYEKAHKLDSLNFFMNFAVQPYSLPQAIFRPIGRVVWYDIGGVAIGFRMLLKLIDYGCFATFISYFAHALGDFKKNI